MNGRPPQLCRPEHVVRILEAKPAGDRVGDEVSAQSIEKDCAALRAVTQPVIAEEDPLLFERLEQAVVPLCLVAVEKKLRLVPREVARPPFPEEEREVCQLRLDVPLGKCGMARAVA